MRSTSPPTESESRRAASDARWAAVRAMHWHDCEPTEATRARQNRLSAA